MSIYDDLGGQTVPTIYKHKNNTYKLTTEKHMYDANCAHTLIKIKYTENT